MDTVAASAAATTARPTFNVGFFTSPPGWLKMAEIVLGLLVFALLASIPYWTSSALQFVMFVSVTVWVFTVILAIIYMFAIHATVLSGAPWDIIEFAFNASCALLYFIGAIVEASFTYNNSHVVASTVFAFFTWLLYTVHMAYAYNVWRGLPLTGTSQGNDVST